MGLGLGLGLGFGLGLGVRTSPPQARGQRMVLKPTVVVAASIAGSVRTPRAAHRWSEEAAVLPG